MSSASEAVSKQVGGGRACEVEKDGLTCSNIADAVNGFGRMEERGSGAGGMLAEIVSQGEMLRRAHWSELGDIACGFAMGGWGDVSRKGVGAVDREIGRRGFGADGVPTREIGRISCAMAAVGVWDDGGHVLVKLACDLVRRGDDQMTGECLRQVAALVSCTRKGGDECEEVMSANEALKGKGWPGGAEKGWREAILSGLEEIGLPFEVDARLCRGIITADVVCTNAKGRQVVIEMEGGEDVGGDGKSGKRRSRGMGGGREGKKEKGDCSIDMDDGMWKIVGKARRRVMGESGFALLRVPHGWAGTGQALLTMIERSHSPEI